MPPYVIGEQELAADRPRRCSPPRAPGERRAQPAARRLDAGSTPSQPAAPRQRVTGRRQLSRIGSRQARQASCTSTAPSAAIVSRLERSSCEGSAGQSLSSTATTSSPAAAGGFERQQRVVDRAEAGPRDHEHAQGQRRGEVAHAEGVVQRHQQPADALDEQRVPVAELAGPCRSARAGRSARPPERPPGAGTTAGPKRSGATSSGSIPAARAEQLVVGGPAARCGGSSRPVTTGL